MEFLALYILLCAIPGGIASGKGRSFWGLFFLSAIISPLIGLIIALCLSPGAEEMARREIRKDEAKARLLSAKAPQPQQQQPQDSPVDEAYWGRVEAAKKGNWPD
jgi:hypothetical protein